jgi:hypothetical protein
VRDNRANILAELAGMVVRWLDAGRPSAPAPCRFAMCGQIIGSVLSCNGLPGFLSNTREEVRQHSTTHQQLVAIAERLIDSRDRSFVWEVAGDIEATDEAFKRGPRPENPREQKDWVPYLAGAGVITAACTTPEKQKAAATQYLNGIVKVPVEVDLGDHAVQVMIVSRPLGKRRTAYMLAVKGLPAVDAAGGEEGCEAGGGAGTVAGIDGHAVAPSSAPGTQSDGGSGHDSQLHAAGEAELGDSSTRAHEGNDDLWGPTAG